jgi:hypothetical protein
MAGTLSAPNAIKDIYKKLVFFDVASPTDPYKFQYTNEVTLDDVLITNVKNYFIFDNQISFASTIIGPTDNFSYPMDVTQLAADIYGGAQPSNAGHLPDMGGISSNWSITDGSLIDCLVAEKSDREAQDTLHEHEMNQIERLITGQSTGWAQADYMSGIAQNPYIEGSGGALIPSTYFIDSPDTNVTGQSAAGLIDADQILDQEILHNRTWLETLQNLWDGTDGVGSAPGHPSGNGASNNTVGTFDNNNFDIGTAAAENPKYIADDQNTNIVRPGTGNTTLAEATSIKDALLRLDNEIHKNESWLSEMHEALYGADDLLDDATGNIVGETPRDNVLQADPGTKITFREFGSGKDHDSWARHGNTNSGSYLTKDTASTGSTLEGSIGRVNSFSQAIAELDYQVKNLWDRRDLDYNSLDNSGTKGAQSANANRVSLIDFKVDIHGFMSLIGTDNVNSNTAFPGYTATVGNSYATSNVLRTQIDELDAQLQHLTDAVQNSDTGAASWSSDVGAGASVLEDINSLHTELDATQAGAGLNADGSYTPPGGSYTGGNTTIKEDITDIEDRLDVLDGLITGAPNSTYGSSIGNSGDGALESDINWLEGKVWSDAYSLQNKMDRLINPTNSLTIKIADNMDANSNRIIGLSNAINAQDAITKAQLDAATLGFTPGYDVKVATQQISDASGLMADSPAQTGNDPVGGLMAIDTSHTLANYQAGAVKTWANKDNITLGGTEYEHGGIAYDGTTYAPKTITTNTVYIDGIEMSDGDYVLVAGESLSALDGATYRESTAPGEQSWHWRNGVWKFNTAGTNSGKWERPDADILWTVDAAITVGEGQFHPVKYGYQNGLSVYQAIAPTLGASDPEYPVTVEDNKTDADALISGGTYNPLSAFSIFTGIQAIGSGNVTSVKNANEIHLDFNAQHFEVINSSPDYLQLLLQPAATAYGAAGTDMVPLHVDALGVGLQVDNSYFEYDTTASVNRLTLKSTMPITGDEMNIGTGVLTANLSGYTDKVGINQPSPTESLDVNGTAIIHDRFLFDWGSPSYGMSFVNPSSGGWARGISAVSNDKTTRFDGGIHWYGNGAAGSDGEIYRITIGNRYDNPGSMHWDVSDQRLGIGTWSPTELIHLHGIDPGLHFSATLTNQEESGNIQWTETADAFETEDGAGFKIRYDGKDDFLKFETSNGASYVYDAFTIERDTGHIGIGSEPLAPLHINHTDDTGISDNGVILIGDPGAANMSIDRNEIMSRNNGAIDTLYINSEANGDVRIGKNTGHASLGIGDDPDSTHTLKLKDTSGGGTGQVNFDLGSVSSGYITTIKMDDTALKIGHTSTVRDIHIKCDDDGTPKGIEINPSGDLAVYGGISEGGSTLTSKYADLGQGTKFPSGGIIMWSGATTAIPTGWSLCDGSGSTPNLQDRFIIGSTTDTGGTHDIGDTGGSNVDITLATTNLPSHSHGMSHFHNLSSHTHTTAIGNHSHTVANDHTHNVNIAHGHNVNATGGGVTNASHTNHAAHSHNMTNATLTANATASNGSVGTSNIGALNNITGGGHSHNMAHTHNYSGSSGSTSTGMGSWNSNDNNPSATTSASSNTSTANANHNHSAPTGGSHSHNAGNHTHSVTGSISGATGNATSPNNNNHTHNTPNHTHTIASGGGSMVTSINSINNYNNATGGTDVGSKTSGGPSTNDTSGSSISYTENSGSGTAFSATPAYYALAFIMKD